MIIHTENTIRAQQVRVGNSILGDINIITLSYRAALMYMIKKFSLKIPVKRKVGFVVKF